VCGGEGMMPWGRYLVGKCFGEGVENADYLDIVKIRFILGCEVGYLVVFFFKREL
jgi:hypothetical protein